jgi:hypothetical protein
MLSCIKSCVIAAEEELPLTTYNYPEGSATVLRPASGERGNGFGCPLFLVNLHSLKRMATARVGTLRLKQHRDLTRHLGEKPDDDSMLLSSSGLGHRPLKAEIVGSNPIRSTMKTYEIRYHEVGRNCCGRRKPKPSMMIRIQAKDPDDARKRLRLRSPGARFESVREIVDE